MAEPRPFLRRFSALDDALNALGQFDARKVRVVELRFFGGLSVEETAQVLDVSAVTVMRDWTTARAWLYRHMTGAASQDHRQDARQKR